MSCVCSTRPCFLSFDSRFPLPFSPRRLPIAFLSSLSSSSCLPSAPSFSFFHRALLALFRPLFLSLIRRFYLCLLLFSRHPAHSFLLHALLLAFIPHSLLLVPSFPLSPLLLASSYPLAFLLLLDFYFLPRCFLHLSRVPLHFDLQLVPFLVAALQLLFIG